MLLVSLLCIAVAQATFSPGQEYHYSYAATSNIFDVHNVTTKIKFRLRQQGRQDNGWPLLQLHMDSFTQITASNTAFNPSGWDLSKEFLFSLSSDGTIRAVYHHPSETEEVLTLKKVLSGVFSGYNPVQTSRGFDDQSRFTKTETDHSGEAEYLYHLEKHDHGSVVTRTRTSNDSAHVHHVKVSHRDHEGALHKVETEDHVLLKDKRTNNDGSRPLIPGEVHFGDSSTGDFPDVKVMSIATLNLHRKQKLDYMYVSDVDHRRLKFDSIVVKKARPVSNMSLADAEQVVDMYLNCSRRAERMTSPERTECLQNLTRILERLTPTALDELAERFLGAVHAMECNSSRCLHDKEVIMDLLAGMGSPLSQRLILKHVFNSRHPINADMERCFLHFISVKTPIPALVKKVSDICFGRNFELHGTKNLTQTQRKACLTVGTLASAYNKTDSKHAKALMEHLHKWLHRHTVREARSISESGNYEHHMTNVVLLEALGNGGFEESLDHMTFHMQPNRGHESWRRGAVHALRGYKCQKSSTALLTSALHDENDIVREEAFKLYKKHPMALSLTMEQEDIILRRNVTTKVLRKHARSKRGLLDFLQDLSFKIETPSVDWKKILGSKSFGAEFGLMIRNRMELELKPLSGFFEVDVYDRAFATFHVGIVGVSMSVFEALACFQGSVRYDLNILKDFGINEIQDFVKIFDRIIDKVRTPILKAVNAFKKILSLKGLQGLVSELVNSVLNFPKIMFSLKDKMEALWNKLVKYQGVPLIAAITKVVDRVKNYIEDVKTDVMDFYNGVVDGITIQLPNAARQVEKALEAIIDGVKKLFKAPGQAIQNIVGAVTRIKLAVSMIIGAKKRVEDTCFFLSGRMPYWMHPQEEVKALLADLRAVWTEMKNTWDVLTNTKDEPLDVGPGADGIISLRQQLKDILKEIRNEFDELFDPIEALAEIAKPFLEAYNAVMDAIKGVKEAYTEVKETIQKGKTLIQQIFGPKVHKFFPSRRRDCGGRCECGMFPSTSGNTAPPGVQLVASEGSEIVCPVNAKIIKRGNSKALLQPVDGDFSKYEILLFNVEIKDKVAGEVVSAGEKIGKVKKSACEPNFIHFAMSKRSENGSPSNDYVDPTPYIERILPVPQWIQQCNEFKFEHLFKTADTKRFADKVEQWNENVEREAKENIDDFVENPPPPPPPYKHPDIGDADKPLFKDAVKDALKTPLQIFSDVKDLFTDKSKAWDILDRFNIEKYSVKKILELYSKADIPEKVTKIKDLVKDLVNCSKSTIKKLPSAMSPSQLTRALRKFKQNLVGNRNNLLARLLGVAENKCLHNFKGSITVAEGHFCEPHNDCLGLSCTLKVVMGFIVVTDRLELRFDKCAKKIHLEVFGVNNEFGTETNKTEFNIPSLPELDSTTATVMVKFVNTGNHVLLDVSFQLCSEKYPTCSSSANVVENATFHIPGSQCTSEESSTDADEQAIQSWPILDFFNEAIECGKNGEEIVKLVNEIRNSVLDVISESSGLVKSVLGGEFPPIGEFCISGAIPIPTKTVTFYRYQHIIFAGPIPILLEFGAGGSFGMEIGITTCILSMKAKATLTPWVGAQVYGGAAIELGLIRAGIQLTGYLLETKFPTAMEMRFAQFPLAIVSTLDVILVPLCLELRAYAFLRIPLLFKTIKVTLFDGVIWAYTAPAITGNVWTIDNTKKDNSPPEFLPNTYNKRQKRADTGGCIVTQLAGRDHTDPAFYLETYTQDAVSGVTLHYAVGGYKGGADVVPWTEMGGSSLLSPQMLPGGKPLYWTIRATNEQGIEARGQCSLPTYDSTLPDGRLEASHIVSSHPHKLSGTLIVVDDSQLTNELYDSLGLGEGMHGEKLTAWRKLMLGSRTLNNEATGYLQQFSVARRGRLAANPRQQIKVNTDNDCAKACVNFGRHCLSFDFAYSTYECILYSVIQSPSAELHKDGSFYNFERLGVGLTTWISYDNIELAHGEVYFITARVKNVLGYISYITSGGTTIDFTPPEPGPIGAFLKDETLADGCSAAVTQRCLETTWKPNHRTIIDGAGALTVFNGNEPKVDQKFVLFNSFIVTNWDGFEDKEAGIWGYTWAAGESVCGTDVQPYEDPHAHLAGPSFWSHTGLATGLHLQDGKYYFTVQCLNNAHFGGSLVTTVCHSMPLTIDTTPPIFWKIESVNYDEDFNVIVVNYNITDPDSGLVRVDFGLGRTKHDVGIRSYTQHFDPKHLRFKTIIIQDVDIPEGTPVWIRLQAFNPVHMYTSGHGDTPLLVDTTSPIPGTVMDGIVHNQDRDYQKEDDMYCIQWKDFFDPDTGINGYHLGLGTARGIDDVVPLSGMTLSHSTSKHCISVALQHGKTYYGIVVAENRGINPKNNYSTSDGIMVDTTNPIKGEVNDSRDGLADAVYVSDVSTVKASWNGFYDPESGIDSYELTVLANAESKKNIGMTPDKHNVEDHTFNLAQGDIVVVEVKGINGAGCFETATSNGYIIDTTPPYLVYLQQTSNGLKYQKEKDKLSAVWKFEDPESSIKQYTVAVFQRYEGQVVKFWPSNQKYTIVTPGENSGGVLFPTDLNMVDGASYFFRVTATNGALLSMIHESQGITIDSTKPVVTKVTIGVPGFDETLSNDGEVLHSDQNGIQSSWVAYDHESGVTKYLVAVGTSAGASDTSGGFKDVGASNSFYIAGLELKPFVEEGKLYYVTVKVLNGAGYESDPMNSKPIRVLPADVPGVVLDGRESKDLDFQSDTTSFGVAFAGFESRACEIHGYEWALGSQPGFTDIQGFTDTGIVITDQGSGFGQVNIEIPNQEIFASIRATTGCVGRYIESVSDGIKIDNRPPVITVDRYGEFNGTVANTDETLYQQVADFLPLSWSVADGVGSGYSASEWDARDILIKNQNIGYNNGTDKEIPLGRVSLDLGKTTFAEIKANDKAGNYALRRLPPLVPDQNGPIIEGFQCTKAISPNSPLVVCSWDSILDHESLVSNIHIQITSGDSEKIHAAQQISPFKYTWKVLPDLTMNKNVNLYEITLRATNNVGLSTSKVSLTTISRLPPKPKEVRIATQSVYPSEDKPVKCQLAQTCVLVSWNQFVETDAPMARYEVSLYKTGGIALSPVSDAGLETTLRIDGIEISPGTAIFARVKGYDILNLEAISDSQTVTVSPNPKLWVTDGEGGQDRDNTDSLTALGVHWQVEGGCQLKNASWSIRSISGDIVLDWIGIPKEFPDVYNDELQLQNFATYYSLIKIVDVFGRVLIARSDGITVNIEPPAPGEVRDGPHRNEDLAYQESTTTITCNWNQFGISNDSDSSMSIDHYEVALGTDRRSTLTRINVHFFVNVGQNLVHTFPGLTLTAKEITYFVTVRAYAASGSYIEGYSNGIKVGYRDAIVPGAINAEPYQSSLSSLSVSWSGFDSDFPITLYEIAISSSSPFENGTGTCEDAKIHNTDVKNFTDVGTDTIYSGSDFRFLHKQTFYVIVMATDESDHCVAVSSNAVLVDTTHPNTGNLHVGYSMSDHVYYITSSSVMNYSWAGFDDGESEIQKYITTLVQAPNCVSTSLDMGELDVIIGPLEVGTLHSVEYSELQLTANQPYFIRLEALNKAGLNRTVYSPPIFLDESAPIPGIVKDGLNWEQDAEFQSHTDSIHATLALAFSKSQSDCPSSKSILFTNIPEKWEAYSGHQKKSLTGYYSYYRPENVFSKENQLHLKVNLDPGDNAVQLSGISSDLKPLLEGSYISRVQAVHGNKMVTSVILGNTTLTRFTFGKLPNQLKKPSIEDFEKSGIAFSAEDPNTETAVESTSSPDTSTTAQSITMTTEEVENTTETSNPNATTQSNTRQPYTAYGIHIPGFHVGPNKDRWYALVWAVDPAGNYSDWVELDGDPTNNAYIYEIKVTELEDESTEKVFKLEYYINGVSKASYSWLQVPSNIKISFSVWNQNGYVPEIADHFNPYHSNAIILEQTVPIPKSMKCHFGKPFYDFESHICEIKVGVGSSNNMEADVIPMQVYKRICMGCYSMCDKFGCSDNCTAEMNDVAIVSIDLSGLNLTAGENKSKEEVIRDSSDPEPSFFEPAKYHVITSITNQAGLVSTVTSNGITIDQTPPLIKTIHCVDLANSEYEPSEYQGTKEKMGAFWDITETESKILYFEAGIGSVNNVTDIKAYQNLGLSTKVKFEKLEDLLQEQQTYYIIVRAKNAAGLTSIGSCKGITVDTQAPNVSSSEAKLLYTNEEPNFPEGVQASSNLDSIGISWTELPAKVEFVELQVIDYSGNELLPLTKVGDAAASSIEIRKGELWFGGRRSNISIGTVPRTKWKEGESIQSASAETYLYIEPGKCIVMALFATSKAHKRTEIDNKTICFKRENDTVGALDHTDETKVMYTNGKFKVLSGSKKRRASEEKIIEFSIRGKGSILIGELTDEDVQRDYGSAANPEYKSYIKDPSTLTDDEQLSRTLKHRSVKVKGVPFFIAPVGNMEIVTPVEMLVTFNPAEYNRDTETPGLAFWDPENGVWRNMMESCGETPIVDWDKQQLRVKLCSTWTESIPNNSRRKRQTGGTALNPTQYVIIIDSNSALNSPPRLRNETVQVDEDGEVAHVIRYFDDDGDAVLFQLVTPPRHGEANVSGDTLFYKSRPNYNGPDQVTLYINETIPTQSINPYVVQENLMINVVSINDRPQLFFVTANTTVIDTRATSQAENVVVNGKENVTLMGTVYIYDPDLDSNLTLRTKRNDSDTTIFINETFVNMTDFDAIIPGVGTQGTVKALEVFIEHPKGEGHKTELSLLAVDGQSSFTFKIELSIWLLADPCVFGQCKGTSVDPLCTAKTRALSFDDYSCECMKGFHGTFCDLEINECDEADCGSFHNCVDDVGKYTCVLNVVPIIITAVSGTVGLTILGVIIGVSVYCVRKNVQKKGSKYDHAQSHRKSQDTNNISDEAQNRKKRSHYVKRSQMYDNRAYNDVAEDPRMCDQNGQAYIHGHDDGRRNGVRNRAYDQQEDRAERYSPHGPVYHEGQFVTGLDGDPTQPNGYGRGYGNGGERQNRDHYPTSPGVQNPLYDAALPPSKMTGKERYLESLKRMQDGDTLSSPEHHLPYADEGPRRFQDSEHRRDELGRRNGSPNKRGHYNYAYENVGQSHNRMQYVIDQMQHDPWDEPPVDY